MQKTGDQHSSLLWLLVDKQRFLYGGIYNTQDDGPNNAITINLQLTAGQIVKVQNSISTRIYGTRSEGDIESWFSGYMLYAL